MAKRFLSDKVALFTESVIRDMTRQANLYGAINLAQGFPDFPAPAEIKQAAQAAIANDVNQYAITWGAPGLRQAIARQLEEQQGFAVPGRLSVVGFDDIESAALLNLSTVRQPLEHSGAEGARRLCALLRGLRVSPARQLLQLRIVRRGSSAAPGPARRGGGASSSPAGRDGRRPDEHGRSRSRAFSRVPEVRLGCNLACQLAWVA